MGSNGSDWLPITEEPKKVDTGMSNRSEADIKEAISNLEQILDSGASSVTVDGETTTFDMKSVNARLSSLKAELATLQGKKTRRPIFNKIDLS